MKSPTLQNKRVAVLRMAFRARRVFGTSEKRAPVYVFWVQSEKNTKCINICVISYEIFFKYDICKKTRKLEN